MKTRILLAATTLVLLSTTAFAGPIPFTSQALGGSPLVQTDLALASDGSSTALAAWRSDQALGGVYAARIGTSGVIDRFAIPLDPDHSVKYGPVAAATSAGFLVVWATDTTIRIRLVGKDGTAGPVTEVPTLTGHNCKAPLIAARADSVVIVSGFCSGYSATLTDVRGVVQQSGFGVGGANEAAGAAVAVADPVGFCVVVATPNAAQPDRDDLIGKRINSNGSTSPPFPVATQVLRVNQIRAVFDGSNDFVLWSDQGGVRSATIAPGANNAVAGGTIINSAVLDFDLANGWLVYAQGDGSHAQRLQSESAVGAPFTIDPNAAVPRVALFTTAALSVWIS
ncbi:MAG TPA: hypothetical protein VEZ11_03585, partial [Thermoanaerobaculia bacterium]|nr:hypothetical protein [Thermoanaerobaculia bacterium]